MKNFGQQVGTFFYRNVFFQRCLDVGNAVFDRGRDVERFKVIGNSGTVLLFDNNADFLKSLFVGLVFSLIETAVGTVNFVSAQFQYLGEGAHTAARDSAKTYFSH